MALPDYVKRAKNNYNSKHELIQLRLPPGSKERLKAIVGDDGSMAAFCVGAILGTIDGCEAAERWIDDELQETTPERPQEAREEDKEEAIKKSSKDDEKPAKKRDNAVVLAELQAELDRKRQEQEERKQKLEQEKEKRKEEEREQSRLEMRRYAESIRDRAKENQEQKEIVRAVLADPELLSSVLSQEGGDGFISRYGQEAYDEIVKADKERRREETKQRERMREMEAEPDQGDVPGFMDGL